MTTPVYTNVSGAFPAVRYYTQFDPYFYTVDNRPLGDLAGVNSVIGSGVDAAIRSNLIGSIKDAILFKDLYGTSSFVTGLELSNPSANVVRVGSGAMYGLSALTAIDSRQAVKQAILPSYTDLSIPAPTVVGQSVVFLIQGQYVDFGATTTETFPFYDPSNTRLPASMFNGELQLQVVQGTPATTGSQVAPLPTTGWTPLYVVTVDYGQTTFHYASYAVNAPASKGLNKQFHSVTNLTTTSSSIGDTPVTVFANAATQGAIGKVVLDSEINIYKPVKVRLNYVPSVGSNAFAIRLKYQVFSSTGLLTPVSYTVGATEVVAVSGAVNSLASYTLTTTIPGYLLAGNSMLNVVVERIGADAADTNTGTLNVVTITAFQ